MRRFLIILAILIVTGFLLYKPFLTFLGNYLVFSQVPQKADVIVVLAGDTERDAYGAELYKQGYAPKIILSGGKAGWQTSYADLMKKHFLYLGIPAKDIILEEKSTSTYENAIFTLPILKRHKFKSVLLVTSPYHSRRAFNVFNKIFKSDKIKITSCPVKNSWFKVNRWWTRRDDLEMVFQEYLKMFFYFRY